MPTENRVRHCVVTLLILFVFLAGFWTWTPVQTAMPVTICALLLFFLAIRVFLPARSLMALRFATLALFGTSLANLLLGNQLLTWVLDVVHENYPNLKLPLISSSDTVGYVCTGASLIAFLATLYRRDESAMGRHPEPLPDPLEEKDYRDQVEGFCRCLERDLNNIDKDTEWSDLRFVPLEATVEIRSQKTSARGITDLLEALRKNHEQRYFLLLGDPGSGKSVSLRKLARDLLGEVKRTRRIPVYINLRDWTTPVEWTREYPPLPDVVGKSLSEWVRQDLRRRLDSYGEQFLSRYFDPMMKGGHFFFILDSFDEIAVLLDIPEHHELVRMVSQGIAQFLGGMHHSRGVLASRLFRKPTADFDAPCELEIRPLSDDRIERLARKRFAEAGFSDRLFTERPDLVAAARNPFTAALLVEYLDSHRESANEASKLPENRGGLFDHYLRHRLKQCSSQMERPELSEDELLGALSIIATVMYESKKSFEVSSLDLPPQLAGVPTPDILEGLAKARLLRLSSSNKRTISFTHRRFAEYFIANRWMGQGASLPLEDIPTDSLWRDTIVLYCEIALERQVLDIAAYCVQELQKNLLSDPPQAGERWLRTLHTLRFFSEAFRARPSALTQWQDELSSLIHLLVSKADYLLAKWALEMAAVLPTDQYDSIVSKALERRSPWLLETIFRQSDRLARLPKSTVFKMRHYFEHLAFRQIWRQHSELSFALKLHSKLIPLRIHLNAVLLDSILWPSLVILDVFLRHEYSAIYLYVFFRAIESLLILMRGYVTHSLMETRTNFAILSVFLFFVFLFTGPNTSVITHLKNLSSLLCTASWPGLYSRFYLLCSDRRWIITMSFANAAKRIYSFIQEMLAGASLLAVLGLPLYLTHLALRQQSWPQKIALSILPVVILFILARFFVKYFIPRLWGSLKTSLSDALKLRRYLKTSLPSTRAELFRQWSELKTQWSKLIFVRHLETLREISGDWPALPPYANDGLAESKIARLEERWRRLNR